MFNPIFFLKYFEFNEILQRDCEQFTEVFRINIVVQFSLIFLNSNPKIFSYLSACVWNVH